MVLRDIEGLAYREIADVLQVPTGTVMSRLHRARHRLKELLAESERGTVRAFPVPDGNAGQERESEELRGGKRQHHREAGP